MASKHWSPACNSKNMSNGGTNNNSKLGDADEERGCEADLYENPTSREEVEVRNFSRDYSRDYSYTESFRKSLPGIDLVNPRWVSTDSANSGGVLPSSYLSYESGRSTSMSKRIPLSGILVAHEGPEEGLEDMMDKEKEKKKESHLLLQCRALSTSQEHATIGACMGIVLTWTDLFVSIIGGGGGRGRPNMILNQLTGYAKPGQILAIMGPSGSGKTTLLDTLAGRLTSNMKQTGQILLNGRKQSLAYGNSAYVTQEDVLMATLTVQEAIFYSARLQLPENMSIQDKIARANAIIHDMGLQDDIDTRIGGWRAKGLSGGQKRRVTIATQILTHPKMLFLDEPTSGLDSAAAYHIVKRLKNLAMGGRTIIASIHQPSSDVFELFTSLYLLSNGRTIYFGPTFEASKFFSVNNFPCAPHRSPSDHYLRTINADFQRDVEEGDINEKLSTAEVIDILVEAYKKSDVAREVLKTVHEVPKMFQGTPILETRSSHANFFTQVYVLTIRSFKNMYRDLGYYWLRLAIYIALCLCVGTIFYDVGFTYNSIQARASMLMFVAAFLTFMAIGGFPSFVEDMKVFEAERLNGHYGVASFVVANTLSSIPFLLLISIVPGAMAYFLVNLHNGLDHFIFFILTLFTCLILVESLMMMVASLVPDFLLGIITGAGIQGVFMLNGGFFRLPNDLPKPLWRYPVSYMAFHFYANQGFYKNDFEGLTFESNVPGSPSISGDSILRDTYQVTMSYSKWVNLGILVGMAILYRLLFFFLIKLKERLRPVMRNFMSRHTKH